MPSAEERTGKVYIAPAGSTSPEDFKPLGTTDSVPFQADPAPYMGRRLSAIERYIATGMFIDRPTTALRALIWGPTCDAQTELLHRVQCHADGRNPGEPVNWRGERAFRAMPTTERTFIW